MSVYVKDPVRVGFLAHEVWACVRARPGHEPKGADVGRDLALSEVAEVLCMTMLEAWGYKYQQTCHEAAKSVGCPSVETYVRRARQYAHYLESAGVSSSYGKTMDKTRGIMNTYRYQVEGLPDWKESRVRAWFKAVEAHMNIVMQSRQSGISMDPRPETSRKSGISMDPRPQTTSK